MTTTKAKPVKVTKEAVIDIGWLFERLIRAQTAMDALLKQIPKAKGTHYRDVGDLLAEAREIEKQSKKLVGVYKELLMAVKPAKVHEFHSDTWEVLISEKTRVSLDTESVLEDIKVERGYTEEQLIEYKNEHSRETTYEEIRTKRLKLPE